MIKKYPSILVLGSTGSVGCQALEVAREKNIRVLGLSANKNTDLIEKQAREFRPLFAVMSDIKAANDLKVKLADTDIKVFGGKDSVCGMIEQSSAEAAVNSIIGEAGLLPTLAVIKSGMRLALANKESLVVAGNIVMNVAREHNTVLTPVDSEHCAIHQCLSCGRKKEVSRLILTASGGPFFGYTAEMLKKITVQQALAHPTWKMGAKITVDSATLMNKGFEIIEAVHLFGIDVSKTDVLVHRESIIHSMVEYIDNSVIAQLSVPDMKQCVQYALTYPERDNAFSEKLDLCKIGKLTFAEPDTGTFVLPEMARRSIKDGGAMCAVLNAANEVAVEAFLHEKIGFYKISEIVCEVYEKMNHAKKAKSLEDIIECDLAARQLTHDIIY